jgi:hypothetical protein
MLCTCLLAHPMHTMSVHISVIHSLPDIETQQAVWHENHEKSKMADSSPPPGGHAMPAKQNPSQQTWASICY